MKYIDMQYEFLKLRKTPQSLVSILRDYLEMCRDLEYDIKSNFILYPRNLMSSHNKVAKRYKQKSDSITKKKFNAAYKRIAGQLDYEKDSMQIVYPDTPDDVISEGHALRHCVDSYVSRVAKGECIVLFLRQCSEPSKPFYTIEIRDQKIVQVRGLRNCSATSEVQAFIDNWEQHVLSRIDTVA